MQRNRGKKIEWERLEISSRKLEIIFKGNFHAKTSTIKDRNIMDLTGAEEIKKRWKEYTELDKKVLLDSQDSVVTHPETAILECEVKWALGNIT